MGAGAFWSNNNLLTRGCLPGVEICLGAALVATTVTVRVVAPIVAFAPIGVMAPVRKKQLERHDLVAFSHRYRCYLHPVRYNQRYKTWL